MDSNLKRTLKTKYQTINHLNNSNNNKYTKIKNINNLTKKDVKFY
jgi:hypothetical protein